MKKIILFSIYLIAIKNIHSENIFLTKCYSVDKKEIDLNFEKIKKEVAFPIVQFVKSIENNGHYGISIFADPKININDNCILVLHGTFENLFSAPESRNFIKKESDDAKTINKDLNIKVDPGFSLEFIVGPSFTLEELNILLGYDLCFQQQERFGRIQTLFANEFDIRKGIRSQTTQNKFFAKVDYNVLNKNYNWIVSLVAEQTFLPPGQEDFTVSANFDVIF